ncbi:unnamed protein product, partial [Ectocarpus sp. 4 AP-2014]
MLKSLRSSQPATVKCGYARRKRRMGSVLTLSGPRKACSLLSSPNWYGPALLDWQSVAYLVVSLLSPDEPGTPVAVLNGLDTWGAVQFLVQLRALGTLHEVSKLRNFHEWPRLLPRLVEVRCAERTVILSTDTLLVLDETLV